MKFYAGIGSRETPPGVLALMTEIAHTLRGHTPPLGRAPEKPEKPELWTPEISPVWLSGGHGGPADEAFERGAYACARLFLPWKGFARERPIYTTNVYEEPSGAAREMAAKHHPEWGRCDKWSRALLARNCHVILGAQLTTPVWHVICWTPEGSLTGALDGTPLRGGTNHALRVAAAHEVPVLNLALRAHQIEARQTEWGKLATEDAAP